MNQTDDLARAEQLNYREFMRDGLSEILTGFVLLLIPGIFLMPSMVSIFVILFVIFMPRIVERLKKRYTYPRIGYMKPRVDEPTTYSPRFSLGLAAGVLLVFIIAIAIGYSMWQGLIDRYFIWRWLPTAFGFIMWGPSLFLRDRTGQNIYLVFGVLASLTGVLVSLNPFTGAEGAILFYMASWGIGLMLLGLIKQVRFTRQYPVIDQPGDASYE
jgi:hypothetical protein